MQEGGWRALLEHHAREHLSVPELLGGHASAVPSHQARHPLGIVFQSPRPARHRRRHARPAPARRHQRIRQPAVRVRTLSPDSPADRPPRSSCGHPAVVASLDDRESRELRRLMARYVPGTVGRRGKALNAPARWRGRQCSASVSSGSGAVAARWPAAGPQGAWCGIGRRWVAGMSATNGAGSPADPAPGAVGPLPGPADQPDPGRSRRGQGTILDAIGDTPLVQVDGIWIKLEYLNPSGSIKARIAKYMIERAEREGLPDAGRHAERDEPGTAGDLTGVRRPGDDRR